MVINLSLIYNKALNLYSATCSEMNTISITNVILLQNKRVNYKFRFSLITVAISWEKSLQFIIYISLFMVFYVF